MARTLSPNLTFLGALVSLVYRSDKWSKGRKGDYVHDFEEPLSPVLYDPKHNILIIPGPPVAGHWSVTADGFVG